MEWLMSALWAAWTLFKDATTLGLLFRRDRREAANVLRQIKPNGAGEAAAWKLDIRAPPGAEWRLAQLSRKHSPGEPRVRLKRVTLIAPVGARLAPGDPQSPGAAWGQFSRPVAGLYGAGLTLNADMREPVAGFETFAHPFPGGAYAFAQFFVSPPTLPEETPAKLVFEIDAEHATAQRRPIRLRIVSEPLA